MLRMRAQWSLAMRRPVIEPEPLVVMLLQLPAVSPVSGLTAVSVQRMVPHGARLTFPVMALAPLPTVVCIAPSMQSMSPRMREAPAAERPLCAITTSHVPLTEPRLGSEPCQAPAHTPERSTSCGGGVSAPPPPPPQPRQNIASTNGVTQSGLTMCPPQGTRRCYARPAELALP